MSRQRIARRQWRWLKRGPHPGPPADPPPPHPWEIVLTLAAVIGAALWVWSLVR